jgi:molecular chaperone GrpE (heat shock protein)
VIRVPFLVLAISDLHFIYVIATEVIEYIKLLNQEQDEVRLAAKVEVLDQLLPVLDDFGRALGTTPPELAKHPWVQGLFLVARRLTTLLDQLGVRPIGTPGETFDPRWHEALTVEASARPSRRVSCRARSRTCSCSTSRRSRSAWRRWVA